MRDLLVNFVGGLIRNRERVVDLGWLSHCGCVCVVTPLYIHIYIGSVSVFVL